MDDNLLRAVCSTFETESHLLHFSPHASFPMFTATNWENITNAFDMLEFPPIEQSQYPFLEIASQTEIELSPTHELYGKWIDSVAEISLVRMHPFVTCALVAHEQIELSRDVMALNFLLINYEEIKKRVTKLGYKCLKSWMNFYYGKRCGTPHLSSSVSGACERIRSRIYKALPHHFCLPEVDSLLFGNVSPAAVQQLKDYLNYLRYPHEIEMYRGGFFLGRKRYLLCTERGDIQLYGIDRATFHPM